MRTRVEIPPGTGRWQPKRLTEGAPSTTPLRVAVPLPVSGRIYAFLLTPVHACVALMQAVSSFLTNAAPSSAAGESVSAQGGRTLNYLHFQRRERAA